MEDYLTMEEFERLNQKKEPPIKLKGNELSPFMKFGHASFIVAKAIWFVISTTLKGIYNGLIKLNETLDKIKASKAGKEMMKRQQEQNKGFSFGMPTQQKGGKSKKQQNPFGFG